MKMKFKVCKEVRPGRGEYGGVWENREGRAA
jgi:hypothetical protein